LPDWLPFVLAALPGRCRARQAAAPDPQRVRLHPLDRRGKVSAASQRVPGYEVTPSTVTRRMIAAARLASQVAFYGYDQWRLNRMHKTKAVTNALVQREGFVMPYFDPNVGPFLTTGRSVGMGEIRL
jgi:hypothetical protein